MNSDYIRVTAQGSYSYEQMFGFFDYCRKEADNSDLEKVLIDCVELKMQLSEVQRFEGGQMIASLFGSDKRVALVMPAGQVTKMGEIAANNRGARLLVTESLDEALQWLDN